MPFVARCPNCTTELDVGDNLAAGQPVECPVCLTRFVPDRPQESSPLAPRADSARRDRDDDSDDFDRPPRRKGRGYARQRVAGPAKGLQVIGWIGVAVGGINAVLAVGIGLAVAFVPGPGPGVRGGGMATADVFVAVVLPGLSGLTSALSSGVVVYGAGKMQRLERYGWAQAAAWLSVLPCFVTQAFGSCCLIGLGLGLPCYIASLIFGIQAIQALNDADVKAAFPGLDDEDYG